MALKNLFKPAWQSEKREKALAGMRKIKKQKELVEAGLYFCENYLSFIPELYDKLHDNNDKINIGTRYISEVYLSGDWLKNNNEKFTELLKNLALL